MPDLLPSERRKGGRQRLYCSAACKDRWQAKRRVRAEKVYDLLLLMARGTSYRNRHLLTQIDRMVRGWIAEDRGEALPQ
jgi:hypothetical protein